MSSPTAPPQGHDTSPWGRPALAVVLGVQLWSAMSAPYVGGPRVAAVEIAAVLCTLLAVFGLRSLPMRTIVWAFTLGSGMILARFGLVSPGGGLLGSWRVFAWLTATGAALAMAAHRPRAARPPGRSGSGPTEQGAPISRAPVLEPTTPAVRFGSSSAGVASIALALLFVLGSSLLIGFRVAATVPVGSTVSQVIDDGDNAPGNPLDASERLDMTQRPQLTDRVVLTVESPVASFWRTEVYDSWDGSAWTRSYGDSGALVPSDGMITPAPDDLAARSGDVVQQRFRIETGFATAMPAAPSAVRVRSDRQVAQRTDGTLVAVDQPLGRGSTYTVQSRQAAIDLTRLRALGARRTPPEVVAQYAQRPIASSRTTSLADELTTSKDNDLDKVLAIEDWMAAKTRYSIDAPLSPRGVDVVDDFLFNSRVGWCEQIASSLVVMARLAGVPARLASGYVPGQWDPVARRFVVRERDAHSWAEIWFPEVGWVPFDPTAAVPLSGSSEAVAAARSSTSWADWLGATLLVVAGTVLLARPVGDAIVRMAGRVSAGRARRRMVRTRWDVRDEVLIEKAGADLGRVRGGGETITAYARDLAASGDVDGAADLVERAEAIERHRYAAHVE